MAAGAARALRGTEGSRGGHPGEADSAVDPLTGCPTGPVLDRRLQEEFERARRYSLSFSLVLLDVDALAGVERALGSEAGARQLPGARGAGPERAPPARLRLPLRRRRVRDGAARDRRRRRAPVGGADPGSAAAPLDPTLAASARVSAGIVAYPHPAVDRPGRSRSRWSKRRSGAGGRRAASGSASPTSAAGSALPQPVGRIERDLVLAPDLEVQVRAVVGVLAAHRADRLRPS